MNWLIDKSNRTLSGLLERIDSNQPGGRIRFLREQIAAVEVQLVVPGEDGNLWQYVDLTGAELQVAVGMLDEAPTGGTFALSYLGDSTGLTALAYNISAAALQTALNNNPAIISAGGVSVTLTGSLYRITWTVAGAKSLMVGDGTNLVPQSSVDLNTAQAGSGSVQQIDTLELAQVPYAYSEDWTVSGSVEAALAALTAGTSSKPATYELEFSERPASGTVRFDWGVAEVFTVTCPGIGNVGTYRTGFVNVKWATDPATDLNGTWFDIYFANKTLNRQAFAVAIGTATADAGTDVVTVSTAHNLGPGDPVRFSNSGGALPTGISAATTYYVKTAPSSTTLTIAATNGGATLDITGAGTGTHSIYKVPDTPGSGTISVHYVTATTRVAELRDMIIAAMVTDTRFAAVVATATLNIPSGVSSEYRGPGGIQYTMAMAGVCATPVDGAGTAATETGFSFESPAGYTGTNGALSGESFKVSDATGRVGVYLEPLLDLGTFTVNTGTDVVTVSAAHGLAVGDRVRVRAATSLPGGLSADTNYWVRSTPSSTTLTLSADNGGALLDITSSGSGTLTISRYDVLTVPSFLSADTTIYRLVPVAMGLTETGTTLAAKIAAVLHADAEWTGTSSGAVATITNAVAGSRTAPAGASGGLLSLAVTTAGVRVNADLPFTADEAQLASLLDEEWAVAKTSDLIWVFTCTRVGNLTAPTVDDAALNAVEKFTGSLEFNSLSLAEAFAVTDDEYLDCTLEVVYAPSAGEPETILQMKVQVFRDLIRSGGYSLGTVPATLTPLTGLNFSRTITGYTGGGSTNLDGMVTTTMAVNQAWSFVHATDGFRVYQLVAGTDAEASPGVIRPDDYNGSTNAKVWKSRL